jgi:hypothetical protein
MTQRIHIELSRVQTWLFAVPRLRAMVGANALLGKTLRVALPGLARKTGRGWALAPSSESYPAADPNDPLKDHDDPATDATKGIVSREGGHVEAQVARGAAAFADAAGQLLRSKLPGLHFRVSIDDQSHTKSQVHLSTELPVLAPCEWTGRGLASAIVKQGNESAAVSLDVEQRHEAAKRTEDGTAVDVASLLSDKTKLKTLTRAQELKELVGDGYLALIHADGNDVGSGAAGKRDSERAEFFHKNRVLLRQAVKAAIDDACDKDKGEKKESPAPLVPLMLGGDDLLLVCRARVALPFVVKLCEKLDALQQDTAGFKLTLGVGVVFAKYTIPIHRLHSAPCSEGNAGCDNRNAAPALVRDFLKSDALTKFELALQRPVEETGNPRPDIRELRNDIAHNEPTPALMNDARTHMQAATLWSNNDTFLSQPLVQTVLTELGEANPEKLLVELLDEVRRRLIAPTQLVLEDDTFDRVVALLEKPPAPTAALRELVRGNAR